MNAGWGPDEAPYARTAGQSRPQGGKEGAGYLTCYFCGEISVKRSYGDFPEDNGRLELYCTNQNCEAREVAVIVLKDAIGAHRRADVRVLHALDEGVSEIGQQVGPEFFTLGELNELRRDSPVGRRTEHGDVVVAAKGRG